MDSQKRCILHCIVGALDANPIERDFLINCEVDEIVDSGEICQFLDRCMKILYPDGIMNDKLLLFLSDAAPYMKKAGKAIQCFYPKSLHVTCLAHGLHRICEEVMKHFPEVNDLISNAKNVFLKSPFRVREFKEKCPGIPLPPEPVLTRWGTWLNATEYYCTHLELTKIVIMTFDQQDALSIKKLQESLNSDYNRIKNDLAFIKTNFLFLKDSIKVLETRGLSLSDSVNVVEKVKENLVIVPRSIGNKVYTKFNSLVANNFGFSKIKDICAVLTSTNTNAEIINYNADEISNFKYAPIVSAEVERSFSKFKCVFTDRRQRFLNENLNMYMVAYANSQNCNNHGIQIYKV